MTAAASLSESQRAAFRRVLDLLTERMAADDAALGDAFPYLTAPSGAWKTMPATRSAGYGPNGWDHGNWFCGFWIGLLLAAYVHSGDAALLGAARRRLDLIGPRAEDPNTHDIGFIFQSSAIPACHITGARAYAELALRAAERLRARAVRTKAGSYIAAWGPLDDPRGRASSAIDTMANLPLLYWAAAETGDASFRDLGAAHTRMAAGAFVRPDCSTYHAVEYDPESGVKRRGFTFQGAADESCWPRGQAWAIKGFAASAEAAADAGFFALAEDLGRYFLARLDAGLVPYWDFDDPAIPAAPRDSSAAAIAASGFLDLARLSPDPALAAEWVARGLALLDALARDYLVTEESHRGILKHGCYSKPQGEGVDSAVLFGDFYFIEALVKLLYPGRFAPERSRASSGRVA